MKALLFFFFLHLFYGIFVSLFNCFFVHVLTLLSYVHKTKNACKLVHLQIDVLYLFNISEYNAC